MPPAASDRRLAAEPENLQGENDPSRLEDHDDRDDHNVPEAVAVLSLLD